MVPELVTTLEYPSDQLPVRLFRNRENGEGMVIGSEIAALMGYASMSNFVRSTIACMENIHFTMLQGTRLQNFKAYLSQQHIHRYRRCGRLLMLTETGVALLLSKNCKEQAMRAGYWIVNEVFVKLYRRSTEISYRFIASRYLDCSLLIVMHYGRLAVLCTQITAFLNIENFDHITRSIHGYIDNIHLNQLPPALWLELTSNAQLAHSDNHYIFYISGLYRYWRYSDHPLANLMKVAFEREILPSLRTSQSWRLLSNRESSFVAERISENTVARKLLTNLQCIHDLVTTLEQQLRFYATQAQASVLPRLDDDTGDLFYQQKFMLLTRINNLQDIAREKIELPGGDVTPSIAATKKLAKALGVYYMDQITPHLVFVRALVTYAGSRDENYLLLILETRLQFHKGENTISILGNSYRVWKI